MMIVYNTLICNTQHWKPPKCPSVGKWPNKLWYKDHSSKKAGALALPNSMDIKGIRLFKKADLKL
jgi:hypothetical protein